MSSPSVPLNDGSSIPALGFGVFQIPPDETAAAVTAALETGYRHVDTAAAYINEAGVGEAVRSFDGHIYVTTKVWNSEQGREKTQAAFERSFGELGLEVIDLYLIHWPLPMADRYVETWETLIELRGSERLQSIGVSNFQPDHLQRLIEATGVVPAVNQIELHPYLQQAELREFHREHDIITEAWSPLGQGGVLDDPVLTEIAERHARSSAQVVIRWHLQLGNVVIPKSVTPSRIAENFDVFGFELSDDDMEAIRGLDRGHRIGPDPDAFSLGA